MCEGVKPQILLVELFMALPEVECGSSEEKIMHDLGLLLLEELVQITWEIAFFIKL